MDARDTMMSPNWDTLSVGKKAILDKRWIRDQMRKGCDSDLNSGLGIDLLRSPLGRGTYQISETASRIQQIIEAAATEGCSKGTLVLQSLVQGIRDICSMYTCIFPLNHQQEMQVPRIGMLCANDCFYLSDEMLILPLTVPNFRKMAQGVDFIEEAKMLLASGSHLFERQVLSLNTSQRRIPNGF